MNEYYHSSGASIESWETDILLKMVRPDIYRINGFRVLELPVNASPREISSQLRKLDLMEKFGDISQREGGILALTPLPDGNARRAAAHRLNDPESRLIDELFWFWPLRLGGAEDIDEALLAMKHNDFSKAVSNWNRHELEGSEANVSMHNLATMYHALALDLEYMEARQPLSVELTQQKRGYWKEAFTRWQTLLNYDRFWQRLAKRVTEIGDPRLTTATASRIRAGLPLVLLSINATLAVQHAQRGNEDGMRYHTSLMGKSGLDQAVVDEAMRKAVAPIRDRVKIICTNAENEINKTSQYASRIAHQVIGETTQLLSVLDAVLPNGHATLEVAHDEVALLVLESQFKCLNEAPNWRTALELLEQALLISSSNSTRQRIQETIEICQVNLDYTTCWFCKEHPAEDEAATGVKMHGHVVRYEGQIYWQKTTVPVPRCARCKSAHKLSRTFKILGSVLGPIVGFTGCAMTYDTGGGGFVFLLAIPIGIGIGYAAGRLPKGIKADSFKKEFPIIKKWQSEGWALGDKPPEVS